MADISQVLNTFLGLATTAIYPNGTSQPSVAGVDVTLMSGWPIRNRIDDIIKAGKAAVSVFATEKERVVTKFERNFVQSTIASPTLSVVVGINTITINGIVTLPQSVMAIVNGIGYGYAVQAGDTLSTIATALAALIPNASATLNVITITGAYYINARNSTAGTSIAELSRVEQVFTVTCWAPTPDIRTALGIGIRQYIDTTYRVPMIDNVYAQIFYYGTLPDDDSESKSNVFIRKINYLIQYATTITRQDMTIADPFTNLAVNY